MKHEDNALSNREEALLRYVDDRLDADGRATVERWLRDNPDDLLRAHDWRTHTNALHHHYGVLERSEIPTRLLHPINRAPRYGMRIAAGLACVAIGAAAGFYAARTSSEAAAQMASLPRDAAVAHAIYVPEVRHPVEVGADQEAHLVAWLSKRLGAKVNAPQLTPLGFNLVGGRLLPSETGPVAQFMYQDGHGQRLTLYVRTNADGVSETSFRFVQEGKVGVFYWLDDKLGYALSGEVDRNTLLEVARQVYQQLNP
ncbi:anti-sigma factor [Uliginosibacterium sp. sgz301328]|uniref:anti-sigma factor family protein n=1 Tax=Uliginosibacterium sp. sgz301328 TaxID=3243764 RepID=UPI00359E2DED